MKRSKETTMRAKIGAAGAALIILAILAVGAGAQKQPGKLSHGLPGYNVRNEPQCRVPGLEPAISSPESLWQGYDPTALPLEIEVLRTWEEEGCRYRKLRFTAERVRDFKVRVFAIEGAPITGKNLPGILHIHGGGQTASLQWVQFWAQRGYACVSFDFCGLWDKRTEFTEWGPVTQANMAQAQGGLQVHPTPRESSWYHWTVAARRALTLLAQHPQVDPHRIGILGVSVGGNLTWLVAGTDKRVKVAVPIYGSGYNYDRRKTRWGFPDLSDDLALFKQTLAPEAYAPYVSCPILHLDATDDFHAWMDYSYEILGAARGPVRQAFTPQYNHHIEPEQAADLVPWMEWHLRGGKPFPKTSPITARLDSSGIPSAIIAPDQSGIVRKVEVYYALGDRMPPARFWRRIETRRSSTHPQQWEATLPVLDTWDTVTAFANVTYPSGICLSSNLMQFIPAQKGKAKATLQWSPLLAWGRQGLENWYYTAAYTDPNISRAYFKVGQDPEIGPFLTLDPDLFGDPMVFDVSTHIVSDPQFTGRAGMALEFLWRGTLVGEGLTVNAIVDDWGPSSRTCTARIKPAELGPGWHKITLPLSRFVDRDGKPLSDWTRVQRIEIQGSAAKQNPPCWAGLRWISSSPNY